jgi:hypothetical protein
MKAMPVPVACGSKAILTAGSEENHVVLAARLEEPAEKCRNSRIRGRNQSLQKNAGTTVEEDGFSRPTDAIIFRASALAHFSARGFFIFIGEECLRYGRKYRN